MRPETQEAPASQANTEVGAPGLHAPGPWLWYWQLGDDGLPDCGIYYERGGHAYAIARCPRYQLKDQWKADARLIAAAPDLLEAAKGIATAYPDDPGTSDLYDEQPVTITLGQLRRVWAAIAKATGG